MTFKFDEIAVIHAVVTCFTRSKLLDNVDMMASLDDIYQQQGALATIQEQARSNVHLSERLKAQCSGLTYQNRLLKEEIGEMRAMLDEERKAAKVVPTLDGWQNMTSKELHTKAEQALSLLRKEQTRNGELIHQMKRMHKKNIDQEDNIRRFRELQDAHAHQSQQLSMIEKENERVEQFKATIKTQERVIARLEKMLQSNLVLKEKLSSLEEELASTKEENLKVKESAR